MRIKSTTTAQSLRLISSKVSHDFTCFLVRHGHCRRSRRAALRPPMEIQTELLPGQVSDVLTLMLSWFGYGEILPIGLIRLQSAGWSTLPARWFCSSIKPYRRSVVIKRTVQNLRSLTISHHLWRLWSIVRHTVRCMLALSVGMAMSRLTMFEMGWYLTLNGTGMVASTDSCWDHWSMRVDSLHTPPRWIVFLTGQFDSFMNHLIKWGKP